MFRNASVCLNDAISSTDTAGFSVMWVTQLCRTRVIPCQINTKNDDPYRFG